MFSEKGYEVVKNFLDKDFVEFIQSYFYTRIKSGTASLGDIQAPNSFYFYGDPLMDTILGNSLPMISKISGKKLLPTYTYTRLYGKGDQLSFHKDRPSCEISATLSLGIPNGDEINPIYFCRNDDKSDAVKIILEPGDLCLYRGCDLWHWREPFNQKWYLQSFLHYVDEEGPFARFIYDRRTYLGAPKASDT